MNVDKVIKLPLFFQEFLKMKFLALVFLEPCRKYDQLSF